jgi:hypothetical protein
MEAEHVRDFARRTWADRESRDRYWAERYRREGPEPARRAALALLAHARSLNSAIFSDRYRDDDLANHLRLCDRLDRAARAFTSR